MQHSNIRIHGLKGNMNIDQAWARASDAAKGNPQNTRTRKYLDHDSERILSLTMNIRVFVIQHVLTRTIVYRIHGLKGNINIE